MKTGRILLFNALLWGLASIPSEGFTQLGVTNSAGTITPKTLLHVHDNNNSGQIFQLTNTTSGYASAGSGFAIELDPSFNTIFKNQYNGVNAGISFMTKSGTLIERLTILNNGNIGIGNTNPDEELVIGSNLGYGWVIPAATVGNATGGAIEIGTPAINLSLVSSVSYGYARIISSDANGYGLGNLAFIVDRIGVGNTTPEAKLHVQTAGSVKSGYFSGSGTGLNYPTLMSNNTSTGSGIAAYFKSAGTDATMVVGQDATATGALFKGFGANGGNEEIRIDNDGTTSLYNGSHVRTILLDPTEYGTTEGGQVTLFNAAGSATIEIDGDYNNAGYGRISTNELEITGGADLAEPFSVISSEDIQPGMVLSIDPAHPGKLKIASKEYDHCVAGIRSGASSIKPGLVLRQKGSDADGDQLVALTGRVYCLVDASFGDVQPGDLLTSSPTPGHAMKVTDYEKAHGAIIGKAMTSLHAGKGLVLVLVSLQ